MSPDEQPARPAEAIARRRARLAEALARWRARPAEAIARRRVTLGFVFAALVFWLAQPTSTTVMVGTVITAIGECVRIWAAGHVEKSREVTRSGPYRFTRHPLYLGSSIIGAGIAVVSRSWLVAIIVLVYLGATLTAAIRAEESHLRAKFGPAYDAYAARQTPPMTRPFSLTRAIANREHHAVAGLLIALVLLALKVSLSLR
jgi:protein-S-isoprenylcysteine O-methyltransferase Ste14